MSHKIVDLYLKDLKREGEKSNKIYNAKPILNNFYDWVREQKIRDYKGITKEHFIDYRSYLINDYISPRTGKRLANNSVNTLLTAIRSHFKWLKRTGRRRDDPTTDLPLKQIYLKVNTTEADIEFLEPDEIQKIKDYFKDRPDAATNILLVRLTFEEGLRIGEALALNIDDINLKKKTIRISKGMSRTRQLDLPKTTKSNRIIRVTDSLIHDIEDYIRNHRKSKPESPALFNNGDGRLAYSNVEPRIRIAGKDLNFSIPIHWHLGRHSAATNMLAAQIDIYEVKEHMGHEKIETTVKYLHLIKSKQAENAQLRESYYQNGKNERISEDSISEYDRVLLGLIKKIQASPNLTDGEKNRMIAEVL